MKQLPNTPEEGGLSLKKGGGREPEMAVGSPGNLQNEKTAQK